MKWWEQMPWSLVFWMLSFKPTFSLSSFTFIKRVFSSSSLSAIRVVSSAYLRLLIFLPEILIPACASSNPAFLMVYSAYKLNKQGDNGAQIYATDEDTMAGCCSMNGTVAFANPSYTHALLTTGPLYMLFFQVPHSTFFIYLKAYHSLVPSINTISLGRSSPTYLFRLKLSSITWYFIIDPVIVAVLCTLHRMWLLSVPFNRLKAPWEEETVSCLTHPCFCSSWCLAQSRSRRCILYENK